MVLKSYLGGSDRCHGGPSRRLEQSTRQLVAPFAIHRSTTAMREPAAASKALSMPPRRIKNERDNSAHSLQRAPSTKEAVHGEAPSCEGASIHHSRFEQLPETTPDPVRPTSADAPSLPSIVAGTTVNVDKARHFDAEISWTRG